MNKILNLIKDKIKNKKLAITGIILFLIGVAGFVLYLVLIGDWYFLLGGILFILGGVSCVVISFFFENLEKQNESEKVPHGENYVESRFGSIELFDDYFVVSANFVPFRCARRKRASCIIYYDQLVNAMFRPAGWFKGHIWLWSKSCLRQRADTKIPFRLWLPSTSRANSKEYEAIYNKIVEKIHENKKQLRDSASKHVLY